MRNKKWWTSLALVGFLVTSSLPAQEPLKRFESLTRAIRSAACLCLAAHIGKSSNRTDYKRKSFK